MNVSPLNSDNDRVRIKVSVTTRLIAALSFTIPVIGGALSSLLLMNLFRLLSTSENAGLSVVMIGMKEASLPVIVSLYLAALLGIVVIIVLIVRMFVQTKTASPPFWFFALNGILCLVPAALFWKVQLLILDVLSPGSSIGSAGIGGIGAEIVEWLQISVIAAPMVFVILIITSVLPFSSRSGRKWSSLLAAAALVIMFIATAIAVPFLIDGPKRKNDMVNLPANVKYADEDSDLIKDTSTILTLTADNKLYQRQSGDLTNKVEATEAPITNEELPRKIESSMEDKTPDRRIVYFKSDVNASYEDVLQIFDGIRKADVDKVGLVVVGEKNEDDPYQVAPLRFEVRLPAPMDEGDDQPVRPNPLTLVAMLDKDGRISLNNEDMGTISDPGKLETLLVRVFKERENNGVFREGTNEIEKTLFLKVSKSSKYGDLIRLVQAVKAAGARPIGIQID